MDVGEFALGFIIGVLLGTAVMWAVSMYLKRSRP